MKSKSSYTFDLVAMGRACVDEYFVVEEEGNKNIKVPIVQRKVCGGGQAATSAITVSLLGGQAAYIGNLGNDEFGDLLLREFFDFKVNVDGVNRPDSYATPKALIMVNAKNGDRTIYYEKNDPHVTYPIPSQIVSSARALILDPSISTEDLEKVLKMRARDSIIVYDGERDRPSLNAMMDYADFFIASETLLDIFGSNRRKSTFEHLKAKVKGELIFTFGEEGSVWVRECALIHIPAMEVSEVLDTTGAGDVFHAAFAYFYPKLKDILQALKVSTYYASKSTVSLGNRDREKGFTADTINHLSIKERLLSNDEFIRLIESRAP